MISLFNLENGSPVDLQQWESEAHDTSSGNRKGAGIMRVLVLEVILAECDGCG